METFYKNEVKKMSVSDVLGHIYQRNVNENALNDLQKEKLKDFILEIFNKGLLNDYLNLH